MGVVKRVGQHAVAAVLRVPGVRGAARAAGRSGVLPRGVWRRLPVTGPVRVELSGPPAVGLEYRSGLKDDLGRILFFGGPTCWEPEIARVLPGLARQSLGIIDVGAHTGLFTLICLAANPAAVAVAAEPVLGNAVLVLGNLRANGFAGRCVLAASAVADGRAPVPFDSGPVEVPMTSAIDANAPPGAARVPAVTLDDLASWLPTVDLVKIDVEGFEHLVLAGGRATLAAQRPTLVIECLPGSGVEDFADVWDALGYRRFHLLPDRVVPIDRVEPAADAVTHNYLFAARPDIIAGVNG